MFGQIGATFSIIDVSSRREGDFFSVARTTPLVAASQLKWSQASPISSANG